jgi:hypothetical protein
MRQPTFVKAAKQYSAGSRNEIYAAEINLAAAVPSDGKNILTQILAIPNYIIKKAGRQDLVGGEDIWEQTQVLKWSAFLSS